MGGTKRGAPRVAGSPKTIESAVVPRMWTEEDTASPGTDHTGAVGPKTARPSRRPALLVMAGASAGRVFPIESKKITVGRSSQAAFTLDDHGVSRMHCGIACHGGRYFLSDLGSTNGTHVNGGRTERIELNPGDRIQIGPQTVLLFDFYDEADGGLVSKLYEAATRDLLTGALNRRAFQERLTAEIAFAARHRAKLVSLVFDIDQFETVCDAHGSLAGEAVLTEVAGAIASTLRGEDVFARVGDASFVVLGRGLSLRGGDKMAERICRLVERHVFAHQEGTFRVALRVGVAELAEAGQAGAGNDLMELATQRLVAASAAGVPRVATKV